MVVETARAERSMAGNVQFDNALTAMHYLKKRIRLKMTSSDSDDEWRHHSYYFACSNKGLSCIF